MYLEIDIARELHLLVTIIQTFLKLCFELVDFYLSSRNSENPLMMHSWKQCWDLYVLKNQSSNKTENSIRLADILPELELYCLTYHTNLWHVYNFWSLMGFLVQSPEKRNHFFMRLLYFNSNNFESNTIISIHREFLVYSFLEISPPLNGRNFLSLNRTYITVLFQTSPKQFWLPHNLTTADPPLFGFWGERWGSAENRKVLDYGIRSWCMQQSEADSGTCSKQRHRCTGKGQTSTQVRRSRWNIDTGIQVKAQHRQTDRYTSGSYRQSFTGI